MDPQSVTHWLENLKAGEREAVQKLWERYFQKLLAVARKRLGSAPRRVADEDDVVQSVFLSLCRGATDGRFPKLDDRNDLWQVLLMLTHEKVVGQIRRNTRKKRGGGQVRGDSVFVGTSDEAAGFDQMLAEEPSPDFQVALDEEFHRLLGLLREDLRQVALYRFEGYTNDEIAAKLDIATRSVERKLKLIRDSWELALKQASP